MTDGGNEWLHLETGRYMSDDEVYRELDQRTAPREPGEAPQDGLTHLVWSNEHKAWWRANGAGYTMRLDEAGGYTEVVAREIERAANYRGLECRPDELPEVAVPIAEKLLELRRTAEYLCGLAAPRPDAGDGTGEP